MKLRCWRPGRQRLAQCAVFIVVVAFCCYQYFVFAQKQSEDGRFLQALSDLQGITIALRKHAQTTKSQAMPIHKSKDGVPLYGWAVRIAPFLDEGNDYSALAYDEPWNSSNNSRFHQLIPRTLYNSRRKSVPAGCSHYRAVVPRDDRWLQMDGNSIPGFHGASLRVVEWECTGNWMEPIVISVGAYVDYLEGNRFRSHAVGLADGTCSEVTELNRQTLIDYLRTNARYP